MDGVSYVIYSENLLQKMCIESVDGVVIFVTYWRLIEHMLLVVIMKVIVEAIEILMFRYM